MSKHELKEFHVTFGQRFRREQHPKAINGVTPHPDGWVVIEAYNYRHAMEHANRVFGQDYASIYDSEGWFAHYYPKGELARITAS